MLKQSENTFASQIFHFIMHPRPRKSDPAPSKLEMLVFLNSRIMKHLRTRFKNVISKKVVGDAKSDAQCTVEKQKYIKKKGKEKQAEDTATTKNEKKQKQKNKTTKKQKKNHRLLSLFTPSLPSSCFPPLPLLAFSSPSRGGDLSGFPNSIFARFFQVFLGGFFRVLEFFEFWICFF